MNNFVSCIFLRVLGSVIKENSTISFFSRISASGREREREWRKSLIPGR